MSTVQTSESALSVDEILQIISTNANLSAKRLEKIKSDLEAISTNSKFFTNKIFTTRGLLGMGLPVKTVGFIVNMDSGDINTNNSKRKGLNDPYSYTIEKLVSDPEYNRKLTPAQFKAFERQHPNVSPFKRNIVKGLEPMSVKEVREITELFKEEMSKGKTLEEIIKNLDETHKEIITAEIPVVEDDQVAILQS